MRYLLSRIIFPISIAALLISSIVLASSAKSIAITPEEDLEIAKWRHSISEEYQSVWKERKKKNNIALNVIFYGYPLRSNKDNSVCYVDIISKLESPDGIIWQNITDHNLGYLVSVSSDTDCSASASLDDFFRVSGISEHELVLLYRNIEPTLSAFITDAKLEKKCLDVDPNDLVLDYITVERIANTHKPMMYKVHFSSGLGSSTHYRFYMSKSEFGYNIAEYYCVDF